jgi:two-component system, chemotaxis family, chemotaxis protein CheY
MTHEIVALVVEDSPTMRQLIVFALARVKGLRVVEAEDGVDALRKLNAEQFDVILTDINMPIMDGLKLLRRIRASERHQATPIVVITTESAEADRKRAMDLGANAYLSKPVQAAQVIQVVRTLLENQVAITTGENQIVGAPHE